MRLRSRTHLAFALLALGLAAFVTAYFPAQYRAAAVEGRQEQARATSAIVAAVAAPALERVRSEPAAILDVLRFVRSAEHVHSVSIRDGAGRVVGSEGDVDGPTVHVRTPVRDAQGEFVGTVELSVGLHDVIERSDANRRTTGWIALAMLGAGLLAGLWFAGSVVRPIEELARVALVHAAGESDERAPTGRRDEIGQLATAFNAMAESTRRREAPTSGVPDHLQRPSPCDGPPTEVELPASPESAAPTTAGIDLSETTEVGWTSAVPEAVREAPLLVITEQEARASRLRGALARLGLDPCCAESLTEAEDTMAVWASEGRSDATVLFDVEAGDVADFVVRNRQEFPGLRAVALVTTDSDGGLAALCDSARIVRLVEPAGPEALAAGLARCADWPGPPSETVTQADVPRRPLRVLLAEDSRVNQVLVMRWLTRWGHTTVLARDGVEAVQRFAEQRFDVVLMDLQMPQLDGGQATARIRESEERCGQPRTPIVALTAHTPGDPRRRFLERGMDGYCAKPIRSSLLFRELEDVTADRELASRPDGVVPEMVSTPPVEEVPELSTILHFCENDAELASIMLRAFVEDGERLVADLDAAYNRRDGRAVFEAAHKLKGACGYLATPTMFALTGEVEERGRADDWENLAAPLAELVRQVRAALPRVRQIRGQLNAMSVGQRPLEFV